MKYDINERVHLKGEPNADDYFGVVIAYVIPGSDNIYYVVHFPGMGEGFGCLFLEEQLEKTDH